MLTMHLAMGIVFLCLAVLFAASVGWFGGITWVLVWPAFSLIVVGSGYVWVGPGVIGKRPDGTIPWYTALPVMPYLGVAQLAWWGVRVMGDEDAYNEVAPGLYLGRRLNHWEMPPRLRVVIDMTAELIEPHEVRRDARYLCLPTLDGAATSPQALAALIRGVVHAQGHVFVHCAAGHGRSAMALAVLMVARGEASDVDDAVAKMRAARPRVRLRTTQRRVAVEAARLLTAQNFDGKRAHQ